LFTWKDFMPSFPVVSPQPAAAKKQQTAKDIEDILMMWVKGTNAAFAERKGRRYRRGA
jgi:hypothetical protein